LTYMTVTQFTEIPIINSSALKKGWIVAMLYTVRHVVERFIIGGNTVINLRAIDLSKAFDKVSHHALLMKKNLHVVLIHTYLDILENWLKNCF